MTALLVSATLDNANVAQSVHGNRGQAISVFWLSHRRTHHFWISIVARANVTVLNFLKEVSHILLILVSLL